MRKKKKYISPELKEVKLTPEDAVLTACKKGPQENGPTTATRCNQTVCVKSANS